MPYFNASYEDKYIVLNDRVRFAIDCSIHIIVEDREGNQITDMVNVAESLGCILRTVKYELGRCRWGPATEFVWYAPNKIVFEKNGELIEIYHRAGGIFYRRKTLKHNCKSKHAKISIDKKYFEGFERVIRHNELKSL